MSIIPEVLPIKCFCLEPLLTRGSMDQSKLTHLQNRGVGSCVRERWLLPLSSRNRQTFVLQPQQQDNGIGVPYVGEKQAGRTDSKGSIGASFFRPTMSRAWTSECFDAGEMTVAKSGWMAVQETRQLPKSTQHLQNCTPV